MKKIKVGDYCRLKSYYKGFYWEHLTNAIFLITERDNQNKRWNLKVLNGKKSYWLNFQFRSKVKKLKKKEVDAMLALYNLRK